MVPSQEEYEQHRNKLLAELTPMIRDLRVLAAIKAVPREEFVPVELRAQAYLNQALSIGHGQTISQPQIVALMTEALHPQPNDRILEIGLGSGYQASVLAQLVHEVYSIELVRELGIKTIDLLKKLEYRNIHARIGDGSFGWPEEAPFDGIIVTAAPPSIPEALIVQLKEGGRMVIPLGKTDQHLKAYTKINGKLREEDLGAVRFVPMLGAIDD